MFETKVIFHIDFDAYFVSATRTIKPHLNNKPVAIGRLHSKAIATAVSYELKKLGIKPGMQIYKILKMVPNLIVEPPKFELYTTISNGIFEYLGKNYSSKIEILSIDECYLDVSHLVNLDKSAIELAYKIQQEILEKFKIPLTIGISDTKFYAKMTTNKSKPFGIGLTKKEDIAEKFYHLTVDKFYGIGKPTAEKLKKINIFTIGDLANFKHPFLLKQTVGVLGEKYVADAKGYGSNEVITEHNDLKTIGNSITFEQYDLDEFEEIIKMFKIMTSKVSIRAVNRNLVGNIIAILIRNKNGVWITKQKKINNYINSFDDIFNEINILFHSIYKEEPIKGVGVRISNLQNYFDIVKNQNLFDITDKTNIIEKIIDHVNCKTGKKSVLTLDEYKKNKIKKHVQSKFLEEDSLWKKRN